jgi:hypothetical protein
VRGSATNTASIGVHGSADFLGVLGEGGIGVYGHGQTGVRAETQAADGTALTAQAPDSGTAIESIGRVEVTSTSTFDSPKAGVTSTIGGTGGAAVKGVAAGMASIGVWGESDAVGMYATGPAAGIETQSAGTGVLTQGSVGVQVAADLAHLRLFPGQSAVGPGPGDHELGDVYVDAAGAMWLCVVPGNPGTWRKLAGPTAAGAFHVLSATQRIYDSRTGFNPPPSGSLIKGKLGDGEERVIAANLEQAIANVPANSTAVLVNLTATDTNAGGFFAAFKNGIAWPGNASINWATPATTIGNSAVIPIDSAARFKVRCAAPAGGGREAGAHLIVDLIGYYL